MNVAPPLMSRSLTQSLADIKTKLEDWSSQIAMLNRTQAQLNADKAKAGARHEVLLAAEENLAAIDAADKDVREQVGSP